MTSTAPEFPDPSEFSAPAGQDSLIESTAVLQDARLNFLHACSTFADKPAAESHQDIVHTVGTYSQAMATHLLILHKGMSAPELAATGKELLTIEDARRVDFFNGLLEEPVLNKLIDGSPLDHDLQSELEEHADDCNDEEAKQCVLRVLSQCFGDGLAADTEQLVDHFNLLRNAPPSKIKRLARIVGYHALDIGKTAVGTAAGMALLHAILSPGRRR